VGSDMSLDAGDYRFKSVDFEHPSLLFVLEDGFRVKFFC